MPFALFGAGAVAKSFLTRLPWLPTRLGPVGAPSFRLASRIVNAMRAGHAVRDLVKFQPCRVVLICVPDEVLPETVSTLANAGLKWPGKIVFLCNSREDSRVLNPLRELGAAAASVAPVEGPLPRYIVEGDRPAVREAKHLVRDLRGHAVELDREKLALYMAGISFGSSLFIPLAASSVACVAGASGSTLDAMEIANALYQRWLRAYMHAGKKSWTGPLALGDEAAILRELEALHRADPRMERLYRGLAVFALEWSDRHPELLRRLREGAPQVRA
jgi:predicted short-subunit dehydrogenase-like oxidoreductase (DUF2520 family)